MGYDEECWYFSFYIAKYTLAGVYTFFSNLSNDQEILEGLQCYIVKKIFFLRSNQRKAPYFEKKK